MKKKVIIALFFIFIIILLPFVAINNEVYPITQNSSVSGVSSSMNSENTSSNDDSYTESFDENIGQGSFLILDETSGEIIEISERDYVYGAVAAELPATFEVEALKAQAVAAYSYALRQRYDQEKSPSPELLGAHFSADPSNFLGFVTEQVAKEKFSENHDEYWGAIVSAVDSVFPSVLTYEKLPIYAAYHSISMGSTESSENVWGSEIPYLTAVDSSVDLSAPGYLSSMEYPQDRVREMIEDYFAPSEIPQDANQWFSVTSISNSGTITNINVCDIKTDGHSVRGVFDLRSANFNVIYSSEEKIFTFDVKGYGHGVGLSQYGAQAMALQGKSYEEILLHYYTGVTLEIYTDN